MCSGQGPCLGAVFDAIASACEGPILRVQRSLYISDEREFKYELASGFIQCMVGIRRLCYMYSLYPASEAWIAPALLLPTHTGFEVGDRDEDFISIYKYTVHERLILPMMH